MDIGVPYNSTITGQGFIDGSGTSVLVKYINIISSATPANVCVFDFKNNTTIGNFKAMVDTADTFNHPLFVFPNPGLLCEKGCYLATSSNVSCVNIGYRASTY